MQVRSAGTSSSARIRVSDKSLRWADLVCVMEHTHKRRLREQFPEIYDELDIEVLDISDDYEFMDPTLIELLRQRVEPFIGDSNP